MIHAGLLLAAGSRPTFKLFGNSSRGVDNLNPNLTINGTTVTPTFRYKGGDADGTDWDAWTHGETLTLQAGTVPSYNQGSPLLGSNDDSVKFNGGGYYQAAGTSFGNLGLNDYVIEFVFKFSGIAQERVIYKRSTQSVFDVYVASTTSLGIYYKDSSANVVSTAPFTGLTAGTWYHMLVFTNRDENSTNGSVSYLNGTQAVIANLFTLSDTLNNTSLLSIGANTAGGTPYSSNIAYLALWQQSDWHQAGAAGPTEWAAIAKERFNRLIGIYPQVARGTATPTTQTRATNASLDRVEDDGNRYIYNVGSGWMRTVKRLDSNGDSIIGYLPETAATNKALQSDGFSGSPWALLDDGDRFDEQLVDGDMEAADTSAWTAGNSATLTKESGTPHGGSLCLRVAYNGVAAPSANQNIVVTGNTYRVTGWARGDGTSVPAFVCGTVLWAGTSSTSWQSFNVLFTASTITVKLYMNGGVSGYIEFDDVRVSEITETAPNKQLEAMSLVADSTNGVHGIYQSITLTAATWCFSIFAKKGNQDWIALADATVANTLSYFNISTGVLGTVGSAADAYIEDWGNGWCRCCIVFTGTAASHNIQIYTAEADGDAIFSGDGVTINTYLWGAQCEV